MIEPMISTDSLLPSTHMGPYKFLEYFGEDDKLTFGGREREIREIVARIRVDRTVVLYGRSGLGKTSLLLAGVFPELRERGFSPVYCRVLQDPKSDVARTLQIALHLANEDDLKEALRGQQVVLVLDQFEEFFIRFERSPEANRNLMGLLAELLGDANCRVRVLISLREDYLARLDDLRDEMPGMFTSEYRLRHLTAFGARQAITQPLIKNGIEYETKLISHILDILSPEGFDSLLLQIICSAVAAEAARSRRPDHILDEDLKAIGGLDGILQRYLDAATGEAPPELRLLMRTILDALITGEDTKRAITLNALQAEASDFEAGETEIGSALEFLEARRLVRKDLRDDKLWYELAHERLVKPILKWFQLDRTFTEFRFVREVVIRGARNEIFRTRLETLLAKETVNEVIRPFRDRLRLDRNQIEFILRSAIYRQSDEFAFWAGKMEAEECRVILLELMRCSDATARAGAARAASLVMDEEFVLARECLQLAMTDLSIEVRQASGISLSKLAGKHEALQMRNFLSKRATRKKALEALAWFDRSSPVVHNLPWFWRWRALRVARKRVFKLQRHTLKHRTKIGALSAPFAGIVWLFLIVFPVLTLSLWCSGTAAYLPILSGRDQGIATLVVWIVLIVLVGSGIIGAIVGRCSARAAVLGRKFPWWRGWLFLYLIFLLICGVFSAFADVEKWWKLAALCAIALIPISLFITIYARFSVSGMIDVSASVARRWIIGLLHAVGPFLILGTVGLIITKEIREAEGAFVAALLIAGICSFISYVWSIALIESDLRNGDGHIFRPHRLGSRLSQVTSFAYIGCTVTLYLLVFGAQSIPFFAKQAIDGHGGIIIDAHPATLRIAPNATFFMVKLQPSSRARLFYLDYPKDSNVTVRFINARLPGVIEYLPPGTWLGSATSGTWGHGSSGGRVELKNVPAVDDVHTLYPENTWQYLAVTLFRETNHTPLAWSQKLIVGISPSDDKVPIEIRPLTSLGIQESAAVGAVQVMDAESDFNGQNRSKRTEGGDADSPLLQATAVFGSAPLDLSTSFYSFSDQPFSWKVRSHTGRLSMNLQLTFSDEDARQRRFYNGASLPERMSADVAAKLPSLFTIVLAYRIANSNTEP